MFQFKPNNPWKFENDKKRREEKKNTKSFEIFNFYLYFFSSVFQLIRVKKKIYVVVTEKN